MSNPYITEQDNRKQEIWDSRGDPHGY